MEGGLHCLANFTRNNEIYASISRVRPQNQTTTTDADTDTDTYTFRYTTITQKALRQSDNRWCPLPNSTEPMQKKNTKLCFHELHTTLNNKTQH